jgi:uncharacterized protein
MSMPDLTAATFLMGALSGAMGALLGLGGGVFLVPILVLGLGVKFQQAAAVSLFAVIATSSTVTAARVGRALVNLRLGMTLEVATAAGGLTGGLTAQWLSPKTLQLLFAAVSFLMAAAVLLRPDKSGLHDDADPGPLGGRFIDERTGKSITYRVKRLPLALFASFLAGNVSTLLGIGGGIIKVPVLVAWCGIPLRVAAATSGFMIGVTAVSGAIIYLGHGAVVPQLAAAAVIGTQIGSVAGLHASVRTPTSNLRRLLAAVLATVGMLMLWRTR